MKFFKRLLFFSLILAGLLIAGSLIYIQVFARDALQSKLSRSLNKKVTFDALSYHFPTGLKAHNIKIEDFFEAKRIYLQINPKTILDSNIIIPLIELVEPQLLFSKKDNLNLQGDLQEKDIEKEFIAKEDIKEDVDAHFFTIEKVVVTNGRMTLEQTKVNKPFSINLSHVKGQTKNISMPMKAAKTFYEFDAISDDKQSRFFESRITGSGWFDLIRKDLQGSLKIYDQSGQNQLEIHLVCENNNLSVKGNIKYDGQLDVQDLTEIKIYSFDQIIVGAMAKVGVNVNETDFSFHTKLDNFQINRITFKGTGSFASPSEPK